MVLLGEVEELRRKATALQMIRREREREGGEAKPSGEDGVEKQKRRLAVLQIMGQNKKRTQLYEEDEGSSTPAMR